MVDPIPAESPIEDGFASRSPPGVGHPPVRTAFSKTSMISFASSIDYAGQAPSTRGSGACYPWAGSYSANKRSSPSNAPGTKAEVATVLLLDDDTIRRWHDAFAEAGRKALMRFEAGGSAYALSEAQQEKLPERRGF